MHPKINEKLVWVPKPREHKDLALIMHSIMKPKHTNQTKQKKNRTAQNITKQWLLLQGG